MTQSWAVSTDLTRREKKNASEKRREEYRCIVPTEGSWQRNNGTIYGSILFKKANKHTNTQRRDTVRVLICESLKHNSLASRKVGMR